MAYIYESHMGGLYTTKEELNWEELYCEQCGDSDWGIGEADNIQEVRNILGPLTAVCSVCDKCEEYRKAEENNKDGNRISEFTFD